MNEYGHLKKEEGGSNHGLEERIKRGIAFIALNERNFLLAVPSPKRNEKEDGGDRSA